MANPYATAIYNFGSVDWAERSGLTYELDTSDPLSCALVDSFMNFAFEKSSWECYNPVLMKGDLCGCPDNKKGPALVWCQRVVATLSIAVSPTYTRLSNRWILEMSIFVLCLTLILLLYRF
jgi:hypothetical protein